MAKLYEFLPVLFSINYLNAFLLHKNLLRSLVATKLAIISLWIVSWSIIIMLCSLQACNSILKIIIIIGLIAHPYGFSCHQDGNK